jgi:hypothetical protein
MTEPTPLKLQLEPGNYSCIWQIPTQAGGIAQLPGQLELKVGMPPSGTTHGEMPDFWTIGEKFRSADLPQRRSLPALRGRLANGLHVLLLETELRAWVSDQAVLMARAAFIGTSVLDEDNPRFSAIEIQITGSDQIAGVNPLNVNSFQWPRDGFDGAWSVAGVPESYQRWSDDEAEVSLRFIGTWLGPDPYTFKLEFSPIVGVAQGEPVPLDTWRDLWIEPLRRLVSLATGRRERVTYLSMHVPAQATEADDQQFQVYGGLLEQSPFVSKADFPTSPAFTVRHDELSLLALVRAWQRLSAEHHPLLETYGFSIVIPEQHPRARFLLLIQALEGLYGFETRSDYDMRKAQNVAKRALILDAVTACGSFDASDRRFLKKQLSAEPRSGLDTALKELFSSLPVDVTPELEQAAVVSRMLGQPKKPQGAADVLRMIRNDLAHGNRGFDVRELDEVANIIERVTRAHLLRVLGYDVDVQARAVTSNGH